MRYSDPSKKSKDIIEEMRKQKSQNKSSNNIDLLKTLKKFKKPVIALGIAATMLSQADVIKDKLITGDNIPKNAQVEIMDQNETSAPAFSRFKKANMENFEKVQDLLFEYKSLHSIYKNSPEQKAIVAEKMKVVIEKINSNSWLIENLALDTIKSKYADACNVTDYHDFKLNVDILEDRFSIADKHQLNRYSSSFLFNNMILAETAKKLGKTQNSNTDTDLKKAQKANALYELYNLTVKTSKKNYLMKDGQLLETDILEEMNKKSLVAKQKDDDRDR